MRAHTCGAVRQHSSHLHSPDSDIKKRSTHLIFVRVGGWYGLRGSTGPPTYVSPVVVLPMNCRSFGSHVNGARATAGGGCTTPAQHQSQRRHDS
jgi:hypothetical protein